MPLDPTTLYRGLLALDQDPWATSRKESARRWFGAWWGYASGMSPFIPSVVEGKRESVETTFVSTMTAVLVPNPTPLPFFLALQSAMTAAWLVLGTVGTLAPPYITTTPAAPTLAAQLAAAVPAVGFLARRQPVRQLIATQVDAWSRLFIAVPTAPLVSVFYS